VHLEEPPAPKVGPKVPESSLHVQLKQAAAATAAHAAVNLALQWIQGKVDSYLIQGDLENKQAEIEQLLAPLMPKATALWSETMKDQVFANITFRVNIPTTYTQDVESMGGSMPITHYAVGSLRIVSVEVSDLNINASKNIPSTQTYTEMGYQMSIGGDVDEWEEITYSVPLDLGPKPRQGQVGPESGTGAYAASVGMPLEEIDRKTHWSSAQQRREFVNEYLEFAKNKPELRSLYEQGLKILDRPYQEEPAKVAQPDPRRRAMDVFVRQAPPLHGTGAYAASQRKSLAEVDRSTHWKSEGERQEFIRNYIQFVREKPEFLDLYKRAQADYPLESWAARP